VRLPLQSTKGLGMRQKEETTEGFYASLDFSKEMVESYHKFREYAIISFADDLVVSNSKLELARNCFFLGIGRYDVWMAVIFCWNCSFWKD